MHDNVDNVERELSDSELENISGGLLGHHWHGGFGRFGFGGFGGLNVGLGLGLGSGACGAQTAFVQLAQPQQVLLVQEPTVVETVTTQTGGQSYQLVGTGTC